MNPLFEAGLEVQRFFQERRWRFCFIGGLAVVRWGKPRATEDVDAALLTGFGGEEKYVEDFLAKFRPRRPDAAAFALESRVILAATSSGIGADVSLAGTPYEERVIERASPFRFARGCNLVTCSAEDLAVLKAFADRHLDWGDIQGILRRQRGKLDRAYILEQLQLLCVLKEDTGPVERLQAMFRGTP